MNKEHRYTLESRRVTHRRTKKGICPECHRRSLVRYVDLQNDCCYLSDEVGKCDHENSCGYHYRPRDYFKDHPEARASVVGHAIPADAPTRSLSKRGSRIVGHASERGSSLIERGSSLIEHGTLLAPQEQPLIPLDPRLVLRSHSPRSTFWQWVAATAPRLGAKDADLRRVFDAYCLGATHQSDVIFWQIDERGLVHTGHVMCYNPQGHRQGYQSWTHYLLQRRGVLPLDYQPPKCFFGQHLLAWRYGASAIGRPGAPAVGKAPTVCLVESEKTAVLMALVQPDFLWLATGGCGGLSPEKTACLKGRRVLLFPDSGCHAKWSGQMAQTTGIDYTISPCLERYPPNTDIADLLLGEPGPADVESEPS